MPKIYKLCDIDSNGYKVVNIDNHEEVLKVTIRKKAIKDSDKVIVGDLVTLDNSNVINEIIKRKNSFKRPRIVNIDYMLIIMSIVNPTFSSYLLDKYLLSCSFNNCEAVIIFNKADLTNKDELDNINQYKKFYEELGYKVFVTNKNNVEINKEIISLLTNKSLAVMGQSGVGKSSILNSICGENIFKEGDYDFKVNRGKHITKRNSFIVSKNNFIADTPGFSSFEVSIDRKECSKYFPGFEKVETVCYFNDCLHDSKISESKCAVKQLFYTDKASSISKEHYSNYCKILEEIED